jgi:hypothetical protein
MSSDDYQPTHTLVDLLVGLRAKGMTWSQIEAETEIDAERASVIVQEYLTSNYGASTVAEQRMLQMRRIEMVIEAIWPQVMAGDRITEGKQVKNLLDAMNMLTDLLDLKKDRVRDELVQLTKAQTDLVRTVLVGARMSLLEQLMDMVQTLPVTGTPEQVKHAMRQRLEAGFSQAYANASQKALEGDHSTMVRIDPNKTGHSAERVVD